MSSSELLSTCFRKTRTGFFPALVIASTLTLGGCLRPVYGPAANGQDTRNELASIEVVISAPQGRERVAHYVEQELRFDLAGGQRTQNPSYRLEMAISQEVLATSVNQVTGQAVGAIVRVNADYRVVAAGTATVLTQGRATASAGYDRTPQRFSDVRASRDAEIRAARVLAEQVQTRLAAWIATRK